MKAVIAIDSFKGSLSSIEAGFCVKKAFNAVFNGEAEVFPIADGGEGTCETITKGLKGEIVEIMVTGPLGDKVNSFYGLINGGKTAVIDIAAACGLTMVPDINRNPMNTTSYGVGELILDAVKRGVRDFIIGLGGSATNDGGIGMLSALGAAFYKKDGKKAGIFGRDLMDLERADISKMAGGLKDCRFKVACDVKNPLYGVNGASVVFGPQKGADEKTVQILDKALFEYSILAEKAMGKNMAKAEGAGAAGGLGFAFIQFLNASLEPGIDLVLGILEIEKYIKGADIVVTGEGRIDFQTAMGKAPAGVAAIAGKYGVPVIAFCGCTGEGAEKCNAAGIDAYFPIVQGPVSLKEAMENENAQKNLYSAALQVLRLVKRFRGAEA